MESVHQHSRNNIGTKGAVVREEINNVSSGIHVLLIWSFTSFQDEEGKEMCQNQLNEMLMQGMRSHCFVSFL